MSAKKPYMFCVPIQQYYTQIVCMLTARLATMPLIHALAESALRARSNARADVCGVTAAAACSRRRVACFPCTISKPASDAVAHVPLGGGSGRGGHRAPSLAGGAGPSHNIGRKGCVPGRSRVWAAAPAPAPAPASTASKKITNFCNHYL